MFAPQAIVESAQSLATESPVVFGILVILAVAATITVIKYTVAIALRLALIGAIAAGALVAVGYLG